MINISFSINSPEGTWKLKKKPRSKSLYGIVQSVLTDY